MDELQLEVGQSYLARNGSLVAVIKCDGTAKYPFIGNNGISYTPNGLVYASGEESKFDLILEWSSEEPTPEADRQRRGEPDAVAACHAVRPYIDSIVCYASTMDEHDGNRVAKMVEDVCAAHPQPAEPRLDAPAQVGHTRFGYGVPWSTVIGAAQRYYAIENTPTKEQERIKKAAERLKAIQPAEPVSQHPDDAAVDAFATAMKAKLAKKRADGRGNWQMCTSTYLSRLLREHVEKGDPVDVANLAMMLSLNGQRIVPAEPVKGQTGKTVLQSNQSLNTPVKHQAHNPYFHPAFTGASGACGLQSSAQASGPVKVPSDEEIQGIAEGHLRVEDVPEYGPVVDGAINFARDLLAKYGNNAGES